MTTKITLEVCVASVSDAVAAERAGADRLELNLALELGGLTPTVGLVKGVLEAVLIPVIVMIRPRGAGFRYSVAEQQVMLRDAEASLELGVAGVASGALTDDDRLDVSYWKSLLRLAGDRQTVFHRAFDTVPTHSRLLDALIELGTTRILTSGGRPTALEGADKIARIRERAGAAIEILPGSGLRPENVGRLLAVTGCEQVHGSCGHTQHDRADPVAGGSYPATNEAQVAAVRRVLDETAGH